VKRLGRNMPRDRWFEDIYGIEYRAASPRRWFEVVCQVASGSEEFREIGSRFSVDSCKGEEEIQEEILNRLKLEREICHLGPDIKFKAVETDPPPEEPDWRERCEEWFGDECIEWNTRCRPFLVAHQIDSGSEKFVDIGTVIYFGPGDGKEDILRNLRIHAEGERESRHLGPDIKFKAIEIGPSSPERPGNIPEYIWQSFCPPGDSSDTPVKK
jgi:hypothetical protein